MIVAERAFAPAIHDPNHMAWAQPNFSRIEVNSAGRDLSQRTFPLQADQVMSVVNNWRSSHAFPLNTFQIYLRDKACQIEKSPLIAQRIKRLESIHLKLTRDQTNNMRLTQMQDIGGCRAVVQNVKNVRLLVARFDRARFAHKLKGRKDYILSPKADGYRGYHLVYEYRGKNHTCVWDGLKIEIQIRSQMQHAWATSVESVSTFTRQALKANQGDEEWRRFFTLMSAAIAAMEKAPAVPGTPSDHKELTRQIAELATRLDVVDKLMAYNVTLENTKKEKNVKYYVVKLDFNARLVHYSAFGKLESEDANAFYTATESSISENDNIQVVLVSVDSLTALKRAYPNYFLDTKRFAELVTRAVSGRYPAPQVPTSQLSLAF